MLVFGSDRDRDQSLQLEPIDDLTVLQQPATQGAGDNTSPDWSPDGSRLVYIHGGIDSAGNPIGEAVVWYVRHRGSIVISCFVPADAV